MSDFFKIRERKSSVGQEIIGGLSTFLAMAYITIISIPFCYSITDGIGFGFISYCVIKTVQGRPGDVKPLMWVSAAAFLAMFVLG